MIDSLEDRGCTTVSKIIKAEGGIYWLRNWPYHKSNLQRQNRQISRELCGRARLSQYAKPVVDCERLSGIMEIGHRRPWLPKGQWTRTSGAETLPPTTTRLICPLRNFELQRFAAMSQDNFLKFLENPKDNVKLVLSPQGPEHGEREIRDVLSRSLLEAGA
jgi:hypothetical protein